jgi:curved DNA-binding protein CbpA
MKNYYKILNVSKNASEDTIKKKYKKKALKYHPDRNNSHNAHKYFKLISEAYSVLSDPYERGRYDAKLEMNFNQVDTFDFNNTIDIFRNFNLNSSNLFDLNDFIDEDNLKKSSKTYSYISSSSNKNGDMITKQKITTNINGKEKKYYQEYITDKDGYKKIIKEKGDKTILKNKYPRLKD